MAQNKVLKAGLGYTVGNILIKGINFLAIPIFSRIMSPSEFGIYNVFISYDAILSVVLGLAMHTSIRSANYTFKNQINKYTSSITLIYCLNLLVLSILTALFGRLFAKLLDLNRVCIYMLLFYSFGSSILTLYNNRISLDYSYKEYLLVAFSNSLGNVVISLILIFTFFRNNRAVGRIVGITATVFIISICLLIELYRKSIPRFEKKYWQFAIRYSLPIVPHGISQVLLGQFDRIMIRQLVSNAATGIYSLAGNIKLILTVITDSISTVWSTWFYEQIAAGRSREIQKRAVVLTALFSLFTIALLATSPEIIYILGGTEYETGKYVAIPMIADAFVLFLYNMIVPVEYYTQKTTYIMGGTVCAAVINIITNYLFIKQYGFIAAAYTTLFSYLCYLFFHAIIAMHLSGFHVIPVAWMFVFCGIVAISAMVDLFFIEHCWIRYSIAIVTILAEGMVLITKTDLVSIVRVRNTKGADDANGKEDI